MTDPEENQGSQNREDVDYWVNKYLQNKSLGLLDEAKEASRSKPPMPRSFPLLSKAITSRMSG